MNNEIEDRMYKISDLADSLIVMAHSIGTPDSGIDLAAAGSGLHAVAECIKSEAESVVDMLD